MTNQLLKALCLPAVTCAVFSAIPAHAAIFTATYTGTVSGASVDNVTVGDTAVITYQLDNGGTSLLGQTWTASNIVTVTFNFGNGPTKWSDSSNLNVVSTNSTQTPRSWFVDGGSVVYLTLPSNRVGLTNASRNIVAANWTIQGTGTPTQTTPEPGTLLGLLAVGSLGALARKRQ